jgi:hypothetical protein
MLKHVGRHGDRKVAILFREVPGEDHMCLVVYPETLPTHIHDSIMKTLESDVGQQAPNLADALHRNLLPDGRAQLVALHQEGMIKKIPCNQVIVTPNVNSSVKLDELNRIVKEMETGENALKRLQELDAAQGIVDPLQKRKAEAEFKRNQERQARGESPIDSTPAQSNNAGALDDRTLATNMLAQAKRMEQEAKGMIAEAARMKKEAQQLDPSVQLDHNAVTATATISNTTTAKKRGRPSKAEVAAKDAVQ